MTYTAIAVDIAAGVIGVATATASITVGNAVPALDPVSGAVASQAWTNRALRGRALQALRGGAGAEEALRTALRADPGPDYRQLGVLDFDGRGAVHTGIACTPWCGDLRGDDFVLLGNFLAGPQVLDAMARAMMRDVVRGGGPAAGEQVSTDASGRLRAEDPSAVVGLAERLMAALAAGDHSGGDVRGGRSAALLVARRAERGLYPPELDIDLRVDDAPRAVTALRALLTRRLEDGAPAVVTPRTE